eukprot:scaffold748_cov251-Pinguiococcus_pyrenoidosus.AAC.35
MRNTHLVLVFSPRDFDEALGAFAAAFGLQTQLFGQVMHPFPLVGGQSGRKAPLFQAVIVSKRQELLGEADPKRFFQGLGGRHARQCQLSAVAQRRCGARKRCRFDRSSGSITYVRN